MQLKDICCAQSSNIALKDLKHNSGPYPIYGASGFITCVDFFKIDKPYVGVVKDGAGVGRVMLLPEKSSVIGTMQSIIPTAGTDAKYLSYLLDFLDLERYCSGATIPHIYFKDYGKETIPTHSPEQQQEISAALDKITKLIALRQGQLAKLDQLAKSRFIEMFGNPFENPREWSIISIGTIIQHANNGMTRRGNDEAGNIVLRLVELQAGFLDYTNPNRIILTKQESERFLLKENDFLFARVNGNPENVGRCTYFKELSEPVYHNDHIIRVQFKEQTISSEYLQHLLNSPYGRSEMRNKIKTSAGQYTINQEGIGGIRIPLPPLELQNEFAAFIEQLDKSKLADQIYEVAA